MWVRNGAGTGEYYMIAAQNAAPSFIQLCLSIADCSADINAELTELAGSGAINSKLKFKTEFKGSAAAVQTAAKPGADIFVNQSALWTKSGDEINSYEMADATALLVQAWGIQLKWTTINMILVAERLSTVAASQGTKTYLALGLFSKLALVKFEHDAALVVLEDTSVDADATSFTLPLATDLTCGDSTGSNSSLQNLKIQTSNWSSYQHTGTSILLSVYGRITYTCDGQDFSSDYKISVGTKVGKDKLYHFDTSVLKTSQSRIEEL